VLDVSPLAIVRPITSETDLETQGNKPVLSPSRFRTVGIPNALNIKPDQEFGTLLQKAAIRNGFSYFPGQQIPLYSLITKNIKLTTLNINTASLKSRSSSLLSQITCKTNLWPLNPTKLKRRQETVSTMMK
jgi:hypothetical protein